MKAKRFLSVFLTAVFLFAVVSVSVSAQDTQDTVTVTKIEVEKLPDKTQYSMKNEVHLSLFSSPAQLGFIMLPIPVISFVDGISPTGMQLKLYYSDDSTETVTVGEDGSYTKGDGTRGTVSITYNYKMPTPKLLKKTISTACSVIAENYSADFSVDILQDSALPFIWYIPALPILLFLELLG